MIEARIFVFSPEARIDIPHPESIPLVHIKTEFSPSFSHSKELNKILPSIDTPYFFLADDDIIVQDKDLWLSLLEVLKRDPTIGAVAPVLYEADGETIREAGKNHIFGPRGQYTFIINLKLNLPYNALCGACMGLNTSIARQVGPFDEALEWYFLDDDYCLRILEQGFKIFLAQDLKCIHNQAQGKKRKLDFLAKYSKDAARFRQKHFREQ